MTHYGPWVQDDDFTAVNEVQSGAGDEWRTEYAAVDGPYGSVSGGTYVAMSLNRNLQPADVPYTPEPTLGETKFALQWIQAITTPEEPIDGRSAIQTMREMYRTVSASPYTEGVGFYWPGMIGGPGVPDGVVGVQWEGMDEPSFLYPLYAPAEVVGLTISGHMDAEFLDSMHTADVTVLSDGYEFTVAVIADVGESWDSGADPPEPSVIFDDDLIDEGVWDSSNTAGGPDMLNVVGLVSGPVPEDYTSGQSVELEVPAELLDPMGRVLLYTQMDFATEGPLIAATAEQPDPPGITGTLGYGYHLSDGMTATWTLRPRRYRWIFEGGAVAPPWRLFPRDDSLRNSPRLFPPPTTRQRSNRISGTW